MLIDPEQGRVAVSEGDVYRAAGSHDRVRALVLVAGMGIGLTAEGGAEGCIRATDQCRATRSLRRWWTG